MACNATVPGSIPDVTITVFNSPSSWFESHFKPVVPKLNLKELLGLISPGKKDIFLKKVIEYKSCPFLETNGFIC